MLINDRTTAQYLTFERVRILPGMFANPKKMVHTRIALYWRTQRTKGTMRIEPEEPKELEEPWEPEEP